MARRTRASLDRRTKTGMWRQGARWNLVDQGPSGAVLANDGTVVTFNGVCSVASGSHVMAFYRPDGTVIQLLSLHDMLVAEDYAIQSRVVQWRDWMGSQ